MPSGPKMFCVFARVDLQRSAAQLFVNAHHQTVVHVSTTVKYRVQYRAYIWSKTHISSDTVVIMCVSKQHLWCFSATISRLLRLKSTQNRCFGCKNTLRFS